MTSDNQKIIIVGVLSLIILLIVYLVVNKFLKKKEENTNETKYIDLLTTPYFNGQYYKSDANYIPIEESNAKQISILLNEELKKIRFWFGGDRIPNPDTVLSLIGKLPNRTSISQVTETYFKLFEKDLRGHLLENLSDEHEQQLIRIILNLPED